MTKPSQDADRLETVQRAARYVVSRSTIGQARFAAMEIFPPEPGASSPKSGTPEYAWRQQLAWTWAKAGFLHEALAGTGLQKRRIYTLLQTGREALERIAADPVLASFYIANKRTSENATNRPEEFFRPPQLVRAQERARRIVSASPDEDALPNKGLRLVPPRIDSSSDGAPLENEIVPGERETASQPGDLQEMLSELRGLPVFFENITAVLERMNERLVKVESVTQNQSALLVETSKRIVPVQDGKNAPATRDEIATALAELTQSFLRDNPQNLAIGASLKRHEEFHVQLASEVASLAASAAKKGATLDDVALAKIGSTMREIVSREIKPTLSQKIDERLATLEAKLGDDMMAIVRVSAHLASVASDVASGNKEFETALTEKIEQGLKTFDVNVGARLAAFETAIGTVVASEVDKRVAAHIAVMTKVVDERFEALTSNIEKRLESRLAAMAPDVDKVRKLSEKLESEIAATCETLKEDLASISADAQDLAERVDSVVESFDAGHQEFKKQGEIVVANFRYVSGAAEVVLEGARAVASEMIALARLRAMKNGATLEETFAATNAALTRVAEAEVKMIGTVSALGGGLIRPQGSPLSPIIVRTKEAKEEES